MALVASRVIERKSVPNTTPSSASRKTCHLVGALALAVVLAACGEKLSREDFVLAVKDKTASDVQSKMGKPDYVDESTPGVLKWEYRSKTFSTGDSTKLDKKTIIVFQQRETSLPATVADVLYD
jgi:hypothetical protein